MLFVFVYSFTSKKTANQGTEFSLGSEQLDSVLELLVWNPKLGFHSEISQCLDSITRSQVGS